MSLTIPCDTCKNQGKSFAVNVERFWETISIEYKCSCHRATVHHFYDINPSKQNSHHKTSSWLAPNDLLFHIWGNRRTKRRNNIKETSAKRVVINSRFCVFSQPNGMLLKLSLFILLRNFWFVDSKQDRLALR